jgi:protein-disulfide isomerase-like protein with CxxC motif
MTREGQEKLAVALRRARGAKLFFIHMTGCHACHGALPIVREYVRRHGSYIKVQLVDAASIDWSKRSWEPEGFPTFVLVRADGKRIVQLGAPDTFDELVAWVDKSLAS